MFHIHQQAQVQYPRIEMYVEFEHITTDEVQHDPDVQDDRTEAYERMNNDSDEEFEATYEVGDEDKDDDGEIDERQFILFIGVTDPEDGEFRIEMKYSYRKLVIAAIRSYTISRGVNYIVYESESQTFYAKCKNYGRGCDWLI
ncbi:hypothetical protein Ahy_B05g076201 [Arachis hypogaea]|uniref:Uncharacterized protein n=1 Tax=Arachis hypogaea TaxID=3818 RepID=A0A444Z2T2_ARAHY|nr:hypothetical protein Ahy_B05g076201 [Arachis hypogaea]